MAALCGLDILASSEVWTKGKDEKEMERGGNFVFEDF